MKNLAFEEVANLLFSICYVKSVLLYENCLHFLFFLTKEHLCHMINMCTITKHPIFRVQIWLSIKLITVWIRWENGANIIMQPVVRVEKEITVLIYHDILIESKKSIHYYMLSRHHYNDEELLLTLQNYYLGLKKKVLQSTTSEGEAEKQVFNKIRTPFFWVYFIKFLGSNPCFRTRKREDRVQYLFGNNNFWNFVFSDDNFFFMS